jgi:hypothetical protein
MAKKIREIMPLEIAPGGPSHFLVPQKSGFHTLSDLDYGRLHQYLAFCVDLSQHNLELFQCNSLFV